MDRYNRYPRRQPLGMNGAHPASHGSHASAHREDDPHCLCDSQPLSLAMAYVKIQPFGDPLSAEQGWKNGSLFPSLLLPYCAGGGKKR